MRSKALPVLAWALGGLLAVGVASAAVGRVGNQVTGDRPSALSAAEVQDELAAEASTSTSTIATIPSSTTSTTSSTPASPTTTVAGPTPTTASASETRTYPLIGGTVTLRFSPSGVTVVVATPNPGYDVEVEPYGPNGVEVEFENATHRSKVEAWWDGGPQDEVEERDED